MVMVIVRLLLGENHRLRGWLAVKANSPRLKTTMSGLSAYTRLTCNGREANPVSTSPDQRQSRVPRPQPLHCPAFLWSNRSEVWVRDLVDLADSPVAPDALTLDRTGSANAFHAEAEAIRRSARHRRGRA